MQGIAASIRWDSSQTPKIQEIVENCEIPSWILPIEFNIDQEDGRDNNASDIGAAREDFTGESCYSVLLREIAKITAKNKLLGTAMKEYGSAASKDRRMKGIYRLAKHVEIMIQPKRLKSSKKKVPKPPHPHQFLMILHKIGRAHV